MPKHEGEARPTGQISVRRTAAAPSNSSGSTAQPEPSRADRLNALMVELGFDPDDWGEGGSPYTVETLGTDRTLLQINMPDRRVHVGVGSDLDAAIADIEQQLRAGGAK